MPHKTPQDYIEEAVKEFDEKFDEVWTGSCSCCTGFERVTDALRSFLQSKLQEMHDLTWKEARDYFEKKYEETRNGRD